MSDTYTDDNFNTEVLQSKVPVVVDFWSTWCKPCHLLSPTIEKLHDESNGLYKVGKVNIDECQEVTNNYRVSAVPTVIVFKDGKPVKQLVGLQPAKNLLEAIMSVV